MRIIGFDISSTTVGWAVLDIKNKSPIKLYDYGYLKPSKKELHIFAALANFKQEILEILQQYQPDKVAIEDIVQFLGGGSTAATIIKLSLYNRTAGSAVFEYLKEPPELYNVISIRHGLKLSKILPKKEEMPELVETILGVTLERQFNKNGKLKSELYDQADAIAVALFYVLKNTDKLDYIKNNRKK